MLRIIHPVAGVLALATIATFWTSTVVSELLLSDRAVLLVKTSIPCGLLLLIPALAVAGGSGFRLSRGTRKGLPGQKLRRMPWIVANGLLVLVPSALFLAARAREGDFDATFHAIQAVELVAGGVNIVLLALQMRDGLRLTRRRRRA
ncbi:MAG TPA: hypothetical protein VGO22_21650 [Pseudorhizobium sp.]|jgi:hypothetical protein|nr:hypothetical protein [Pseudorhizobium sp.]